MIPEGYMTLEEFGELFHKKLDDLYLNHESLNEVPRPSGSE